MLNKYCKLYCTPIVNHCFVKLVHKGWNEVPEPMAPQSALNLRYGDTCFAGCGRYITCESRARRLTQQWPNNLQVNSQTYIDGISTYQSRILPNLWPELTGYHTTLILGQNSSTPQLAHIKLQSTLPDLIPTVSLSSSSPSRPSYLVKGKEHELTVRGKRNKKEKTSKKKNWDTPELKLTTVSSYQATVYSPRPHPYCITLILLPIQTIPAYLVKGKEHELTVREKRNQKEKSSKKEKKSSQTDWDIHEILYLRHSRTQAYHS